MCTFSANFAFDKATNGQINIYNTKCGKHFFSSMSLLKNEQLTVRFVPGSAVEMQLLDFKDVNTLCVAVKEAVTGCSLFLLFVWFWLRIYSDGKRSSATSRQIKDKPTQCKLSVVL